MLCHYGLFPQALERQKRGGRQFRGENFFRKAAHAIGREWEKRIQAMPREGSKLPPDACAILADSDRIGRKCASSRILCVTHTVSHGGLMEDPRLCEIAIGNV
jgi:hypothetical protein